MTDKALLASIDAKLGEIIRLLRQQPQGGVVIWKPNAGDDDHAVKVKRRDVRRQHEADERQREPM